MLSDSIWGTLKRRCHVENLMWAAVEMALWEGWNEKQGAFEGTNCAGISHCTYHRGADPGR